MKFDEFDRWKGRFAKDSQHWGYLSVLWILNFFAMCVSVESICSTTDGDHRCRRAEASKATFPFSRLLRFSSFSASHITLLLYFDYRGNVLMAAEVLMSSQHKAVWCHENPKNSQSGSQITWLGFPNPGESSVMSNNTQTGTQLRIYGFPNQREQLGRLWL